MKDSTLKHLQSGSNEDQHSLDVLIPMLKQIHPDKDLDDIKTLIYYLKQEFDVIFSESDIVNHYVIEMEQKDAKLTYNHYVR